MAVRGKRNGRNPHPGGYSEDQKSLPNTVVGSRKQPKATEGVESQRRPKCVSFNQEVRGTPKEDNAEGRSEQISLTQRSISSGNIGPTGTVTTGIHTSPLLLNNNFLQG